MGNNNSIDNSRVTIRNNETIVKKNVIKPGPEHISDQEAYKIQQLIYKLAERDAATGYANCEVGKARAKWWLILRKHFEISSYKLLPSHLFDEAMTYLRQHKAMTRSKLKKTNKSEWRNEHYSAIYARTGQKHISKGELYALVNNRMKLRITSLKQLNDTNLKKLYNIVMAI